MPRFAIDVWQPDAALTPFVASYVRYHVADDPAAAPWSGPFYAEWGNLRISAERNRWSLTFGNRRYPDVPGIALVGATSRLGTGETAGETVWAAMFTPIGWARFVRASAAGFVDRVTPVDALAGLALAPIADALRAGTAVAATLDAFFAAALARTAPPDAIVLRLGELLGDPAIRTVTQLSAASGLTPMQLGRVVPRHFGFTPKRLIRRRRFLAVLLRAQALERGHWVEALAGSDYFDQAHFLRDCQSFLGMPLGRFLSLDREAAGISGAAMVPAAPPSVSAGLA